MRLRNDFDDAEFISLTGGDDDTVKKRALFELLKVLMEDWEFPSNLTLNFYRCRYLKLGTHDLCGRKMMTWTMERLVWKI